MHVLDLFNQKDRDFFESLGEISEGKMKELDIEYQDYLNLAPVNFFNRYKITKREWLEKYKDLLPKQAGANEPNVHESIEDSLEHESLRKLERVIKSVMNPEQLTSAKNYANYMFYHLRNKIKDEKDPAKSQPIINKIKEIENELRQREQSFYDLDDRYLGEMQKQHPAYQNLAALQKAVRDNTDAEIYFTGSNEPTIIEYPLARHLMGKYRALSQSDDRLRAEFLGSLTDARKFDRLTFQYKDITDRARAMGQGQAGTVEEDGKLKGGAKDPCWKGYQMVGTKKKGGREVPNCVPRSTVKENTEDNPMASSLVNRIIRTRTDLLSKYGPEAVMQAIEDVTSGEADWDEIGTSDVSAYVKYVEEYLADHHGSREEMDPRKPFAEQDAVSFNRGGHNKLRDANDYKEKMQTLTQLYVSSSGPDKDKIKQRILDLDFAARKQGLAEIYNPLDDERREQRAMDREREQFKRDELEFELRGEEERMRQEFSGTWFLRINGRIWKKNGVPVQFRGKQAARRAGQTIKDRDPSKDVVMTVNPVDKPQGVAETRKLSPREKLLKGLKRGGYDVEERHKYWSDKSAELQRQQDEYEKDLENKTSDEKKGVEEGNIYDKTPKPRFVDQHGNPLQKPQPATPIDPEAIGNVRELPDGTRQKKTANGWVTILGPKTNRPRAITEEDDLLKISKSLNDLGNMMMTRGMPMGQTLVNVSDALTSQGIDAARKEFSKLDQFERTQILKSLEKLGVDPKVLTGVMEHKKVDDFKITKKYEMAADGSKQEFYEVTDRIRETKAFFDDLQKAKKYLDESIGENPTDTVEMDIPLLLRMLEFAREDAKTDLDLHHVTEKMIELSKSGEPLSMHDYSNITDSESESEEDVYEGGKGRYWCKTEKRWKDG